MAEGVLFTSLADKALSVELFLWLVAFSRAGK